MTEKYIFDRPEGQPAPWGRAAWCGSLDPRWKWSALPCSSSFQSVACWCSRPGQVQADHEVRTKLILVAGEEISAGVGGKHRQIAARADKKIHPARQRALGRANRKPGWTAAS